jgi:AraC-like DNA-binding protein
MANFRACVNAAAEGNRLAFARTCGVSPCFVHSQMFGESLPRIDTLLRICWHLNIPLTALLETDSVHPVAALAQAKDSVQRNRQLPLSRAPEQVRFVLEKALREQPAPSLSEIARQLGYKGADRLYQVDQRLAKQIVANYRKSGRSHWWRKHGAVRICSLTDIQQLLEQSLAQERPVSAHHIAANLGYANDGYLQQKFPDLCRAIRRKIAAHDEPRITVMESTLRGALREEQVPTLTDLCRRLGYSSSLVLRYHFPGLCEEILARRRDLRNQRIAKLREAIQAVLLEEPAPSFVTVCKRAGFSYAALAEMFPEECAAIRSRYLRNRSAASRRKKQQLREEVRHVVQRLQVEGKYPSVERVTALLPDTALKDWRALSAAVKVARQELGSRSRNTTPFQPQLAQ